MFSSTTTIEFSNYVEEKKMTHEIKTSLEKINPAIAKTNFKENANEQHLKNSKKKLSEYLGIENIHVKMPDKEYVSGLRTDIERCDKELDKIIKLFEFYLSYESYLITNHT